MGSKSRTKIMKAYSSFKNKTTQKSQKKENAPDIISISIFKATRMRWVHINFAC